MNRNEIAGVGSANGNAQLADYAMESVCRQAEQNQALVQNIADGSRGLVTEDAPSRQELTSPATQQSTCAVLVSAT
jgi:hypothetical protein